MRINKQEVCFGCPCFNPIGSYCNLTDVKNEQPCDTLLSDCPLPFVSVPEHHGDLIDVEKLKELLLDLWSKNVNFTIADIIREIPEIPVVIKANT